MSTALVVAKPAILVNPRPAGMVHRVMTNGIVRHVSAHPWKYGIGVAALLAGFWWYRKRKARALAGEFGAAKMADLMGAATRQVAAAKSQKRLTDYRKAEDQSIWFNAGTPNVTVAHWKAAYWLAVAARCSGAWSLADLAMNELKSGNAQSKYRTVDTTTGASSAILNAAGQAIAAAAPTDPGARAAAAVLGYHAKSETIDQQKQIADDKSGKTQLDIMKGDPFAAFAAMHPTLWAAFTGGGPPDGPADPSWWKKWALRGGVAVVGIVALRVLFAPQYHAAKSAIGGIAQNGRALHAAVTGGEG